jgi:NosR/NirI family transcriptional regulator, nitrous oxide reductase regulator
VLAFLKSLFARKAPEPSYPVLPAADEKGESSVPGVYLVGEVAGTPLIKLGLNAGHALIDRLAPEVQAERGQEAWDFVIVGAGASGLAAAARAKALGLRAVVIDANHINETVFTMTKGKILFAEPESVPNQSLMWFEECTKEELLEKWSKQIVELGLDVREFEKVTDVKRKDRLLEVTTQKDTYLARRVILAVGKAGNPRKAGVEGEVQHAKKIAHRLLDPAEFVDRKILIYGGGDVALEAALALADTNEVTLVTIDKELTYPKKRNIDALRAKEAEGKVKIHLGTPLVRIEEKSVTVGQGTRIENDFVFEMIGAELPTPFFEKIGVKLENEWDVKRWVGVAVAFVLIYSLYAIKSYGKGASAWPFEDLIAPATYDSVLGAIFRVAFFPFAWLFDARAQADLLSDRGYQQGYLYSLLYTLVMIGFGFEALVRWRGIAKDPKYQTWRYVSLLAFQVAFFLVVNVLAVQALSVKYAWRAWGLYQPFPLFFNTFFWWYDGDPRWIVWSFVGSGIVGTLIAIPIASYKHGKRFCTWICGCGGLAETLGDRWRHLAPKGSRSRAWEFQGVLILAASVIVGMVVIGAYRTDGNNGWWRAYSYVVDFWLVAVIPIALYPFFGGKVWCRYWCPLAAYNGLLAKWYGKLQIVSNEKCISCTQCSKFCQVGVDVMAFAKNQTSFGNQNSACIQCGICIDVCPMNVLSFTTEAPRTAKSLPIIV